MGPNVDEYGTEWRRCTKCGRWLELECDFALSPMHRQGRSTQCKQCYAERERNRYRKQKAKEAWRREHPEPRPEWGDGSFDEEGNWRPDPEAVEWLRRQKEERRAVLRESAERGRQNANAYRRRRRRLDPSYCRSREEKDRMRL